MVVRQYRNKHSKAIAFYVFYSKISVYGRKEFFKSIYKFNFIFSAAAAKIMIKPLQDLKGLLTHKHANVNE